MTDLKVINITPSMFPDLEKISIFKYAVLKDKTCSEIIACAAQNPDIFFFVFITKSIEECDDYTALDDLRLHDFNLALRIARPIYVGNLKPIEKAIEQLIGHAIPKHFNAVEVQL